MATLNFGIEESIKQVSEIAQDQFPIQLAKLAEEVFVNEGAFNGHQKWSSNSPKTAKRKGGNSPNIEYGTLEDWMSTPGNIVDDDFMSHLPQPKRAGGARYKNGYEYANVTRNFSTIGKTEQDMEYVAEQIAKQISQNYKS